MSPFNNASVVAMLRSVTLDVDAKAVGREKVLILSDVDKSTGRGGHGPKVD